MRGSHHHHHHGSSQVADKDDPTNKFYQSVIQLGNGFLDVFTSFGGLVAEAFGFKSDPKKSDVKTYFTTVAAKLEKTKTDLNSLPKEKSDISSTTGKPDSTGSVGTAVEGAIKEVSELLDKLVKAVKTAEGASSGTDAIGEVVDNDAKAADKASVTGIAKGIKEIVEAAGGSEKLKAVAAATRENNKEAGKLFGKVDDAHAGDSEAASKAAGAVSAVSGEQILSAIVTAAAAGEQDGEKPAEATNPIAAAIGKGNEDGADFGKDEMKKDDQIAAAIALRGMAKDGKFAVKSNDGEKEKAEGAIKGAAESAVRKVLGAITGLIGDAVSSGLRKVGDSVKAASKETPPALNK
nr:vls10 [synthetic construct]